MQSPAIFQTSITVPTGATTGARIVIDGKTGLISIYNSSNKLVGQWGGNVGLFRTGTDLNNVNAAKFTFDPSVPKLTGIDSAGNLYLNVDGSQRLLQIGTNLSNAVQDRADLVANLTAPDGTKYTALNMYDKTGTIHSGVNTISQSPPGVVTGSSGSLTATSYTPVPNDPFGALTNPFVYAPASNLIMLTATLNWHSSVLNTLVDFLVVVKNLTQNKIIQDVNDVNYSLRKHVDVAGHQYISTLVQVLSLNNIRTGIVTNEGDQIVFGLYYRVSAAGNLVTDIMFTCPVPLPM